MTAASGFFSRERITAGPGFSRWLVPPAALAVHLCIGEAYAFSVFNGPLTKVIGITESAPADWKLTTLGWIFSLAMLFLGLSAFVAGRWIERVGPRKAMFTAACCFGGGFLVSAIGVWTHQVWLLYVGYGVLGGCGLGIGYVSPVSTLIKWFPDRRGMSTGMAIMGFGGGAMIGAPLSVFLMNAFKSATSVGVAEAFIVMGIVYFISMCIGAMAIRIPAANWKPEGYVAPPATNRMVTSKHVHINQALKTPQFWLMWWVLCLNTTAGIGVLGQASVMIQESFSGRVTVAAAAGFVGLMSLFNMGGRFIWASTSDFIGRKATYFTFTALGTFLYAVVPGTGHVGSITLFVVCYLIIVSMYGGGFSTIPAYIADVFGTRFVGGIHGRILTAWSAAGIFGPVLLNYMRQYQIDHGVAKADSYTLTMYIMAGLLVVAFICNLFIRPVDEKHHMTRDEINEADGSPIPAGAVPAGAR